MDIKQLRYFLHVCEARSFSRAAVEIGIAQPALSRHVGQLERELNVELLKRNTRGVQPTSPGLAFAEKVRGILRDLEEAKADICSGGEQPSGSLTVGVPQSLRSMLVMPVIEAFHRKWSSVFLRITEDTTSALRRAISHREADIAILSTVEPESTLETHPLLSERMFLVGPLDACLDSSKELRLTSIGDLPLIQLEHPNALRILLQEALARKKIKTDVRFETNTLLMLDMVQRGLGYTVLPYCAVHDALHAGQVTAAPIALRISWVVAHTRELPLSPAAREFSHMMQARARSLVAQGLWKTAMLGAH